MDSAPPRDDPLHALFSGKRQWIRVPNAQEVTLRGEGGPYAANVIEMSRGGVRMIIRDPQFYETGVDGFAFIVQRFPDGAEVRFVSSHIVRRVRIVRITLHEQVWLALGCQFERPLSGGEAVRLGVAAEEADTGEATVPSLELTPRSDRPLSLLLHVERREMTGPYAVSRVLAAGECAFDVIAPGSPERVAADLANGSLRGTLRAGTRRLWEGPLRVVGCETAATNGEGPQVRLRVLADKPLGGRVHRRFRPVAS